MQQRRHDRRPPPQVLPPRRPDAPGVASLARRLPDLVLGDDRRLRTRVAMFLVSVLVYLASCVMAFFAEHMGATRPGFALPLSVLCAVQLSVFYALLRSGHSERFRDPNMMLAQNVISLAFIAMAYAMVAPVERGVVQILVCVVVVFSMYTLSPRESLSLGLLSAAFFAVPMLVMPQFDPAWFPPAVELHRFELMAATLPALTISARYAARWRDKVVQQRQELREALAQVQELATRDRLTGLFNRRHMQQELEAAAGQTAAGGAGFSVALVDLDHFKRINDEHGHRAGDLALQAFARACTTVLRGDDVVARWGGEEFLVLFPKLSPGEAQSALDRLGAHLARHPLPELGGRYLAFSAGVAWHKPRHALAHTLERADRALYVAKDEGRDRRLLAQDTTMPAPLATVE